MNAITQNAIQQGYEKMLKLPQEKLILVLGIIDQFSADSPASPKVKLGIADGKYHIPEDINQYDTEIAEMFGVTL